MMHTSRLHELKEEHVMRPDRATLADAFTSLHPARVLLAEDDFELRSLLATSLRRDGFEVLEARDGAELLRYIDELVLQAKGQIGVDLIVSDIRMPGFNGLSVLGWMRKGDWA